MNKRLSAPIAVAVAAALTIAVPAQAHAAYRVRAIQATRVRDARANAAWPATAHRWSALTDTAQSPLGSLSDPFGSGSSLVGSAPVGKGPSVVALNPATHTIYVPNGQNPNGPAAGGNTVSVIDTRHCNAQDVSRCKGPWPTITVGSNPSGVAIDERTDTVYVSNAGDNTVSVFNGASCNAENTSGCGQKPATVPVSFGPIQIFADPDNHTVYVASCESVCSGLPGPNGDLSMIDSATCNATNLGGCPTTQPPTVNLGATPNAVTADLANHTVYVTVDGVLSGWSVFDANTCNATIQTGCGDRGYLPGDPVGPFSAEVDPANDTLYTANYDNTISAFDLADCNAGDLAGCATDTPGTVTLPQAGFNQDLWLAVDVALHTVYVVYEKDDALMVVNTSVCNGSEPAGCATLTPPEIHTGADPESVVLDEGTQTLYTANQVDNDVSVIDATRCDAETTRGCRARVPEVPNVSGGLAADPAVHTTYVASSPTAVAMIDDRTCNAFHTARCAQTPPSVTVGTYPSAVAVDRRTHTVYVANSGSGATGTVSVINASRCNATDSTGCRGLSSLQVPGGNPDDVAIDPATDTVYVATITGSGPDLVSVFNGATCNATNTHGCVQTPATVAVGNSSGMAGTSIVELAVDEATNTIYASNVYNIGPFPPPFLGNTVYVINGATCDAATYAGCSQTPATVTIASDPPIGSNPWGIAVDQATNTVYTANIADGEYAGTVSVINGATCNGQNTSGCDQIPVTAPAGFGTVGITVDPASHQVIATNQLDTSITTINGHACNAVNSEGCDRTRTQAIVGDYPGGITIDPAVATAYIADSEGISVPPLRP